MFAGMVVGDEAVRGMMELVGTGMLAIGAAGVGLGLLLGIARRWGECDGGRWAGGDGGGVVAGVVAVQWTLAWAAAEVLLRGEVSGGEGDGISDGGAWAWLLALPGLGVGPNVMRAVGMRWWGEG